MLQLLIELGLAPLLAALATLAGRRFGTRAGGVVSAFPAIVGPVLLVDALEHGNTFAARAANGTLLGLISLAGFAAAYGRIAATRRGWPLSLLGGWACAAVCAPAAALLVGGDGGPTGLVVAIGSLLLARWVLARPTTNAPGPTAVAPARRTGIPGTMALTALLVAALSAVAGALGPLVGGMLAALPVLASVLTVLCHREAGGHAAVVLLRGMLEGMAGFVAFCEVVALLIAHGGVAAALAAATAAALATQAVIIPQRGV